MLGGGRRIRSEPDNRYGSIQEFQSALAALSLRPAADSVELSVSVDSRPGEGTRVLVRRPIGVAHNDAG